MSRFFLWWSKLFGPRSREPAEIVRARQLIAAIDAGGVPLNPARVNAIACALGLEVSRRESVETTIGRIRAALERHGR